MDIKIVCPQLISKGNDVAEIRIKANNDVAQGFNV